MATRIFLASIYLTKHACTPTIMEYVVLSGQNCDYPYATVALSSVLGISSCRLLRWRGTITTKAKEFNTVISTGSNLFWLDQRCRLEYCLRIKRGFYAALACMSGRQATSHPSPTLVLKYYVLDVPYDSAMTNPPIQTHGRELTLQHGCSTTMLLG